jgi:hypothetical protein
MNWSSVTESLPAHALRKITLVVAEPAELHAVNAALEREHYLGAVTPNHREEVQLALRHNQVLAIVVWTRAARKLAARETWLGWDGRMRAPLAAARAEQPLLGSLYTCDDLGRDAAQECLKQKPAKKGF